MAGVCLAKIGGLAEFPYGIGMSVGIAALGILLQFAINKPAYEEEKIGETEEAREKDLEDTVLGERDTFEEYKVEYEEDQEEKKRADVVRQRLREKKTQD
jgi:hypothetical protein